MLRILGSDLFFREPKMFFSCIFCFIEDRRTYILQCRILCTILTALQVVQKNAERNVLVLKVRYSLYPSFESARTIEAKSTATADPFAEIFVSVSNLELGIDIFFQVMRFGFSQHYR